MIIKTRPKRVSLVTMGVAPEMVPLIRALGGRGSCSATPIKINMKKEDDDVPKKDYKKDKPADKDKDTVNEVVVETGGDDQNESEDNESLADTVEEEATANSNETRVKHNSEVCERWER